MKAKKKTDPIIRPPSPQGRLSQKQINEIVAAVRHEVTAIWDLRSSKILATIAAIQEKISALDNRQDGLARMITMKPQEPLEEKVSREIARRSGLAKLTPTEKEALGVK